MRRLTQVVLLSGLVIVTGCARNYVYSGTLQAPDSQGAMRTHLLYWNKTERPLWFDTAEGSVRMLSQCSLNTVAYDEQPTGIVFRARERDKKVVGKVEPDLSRRICGQMLDANRVADLPDGRVRVTVYCEDAPPDELSRPQPYVKAREQPYEFTISRRAVSDFSEIPVRPRCESP